MNTTKPTPRVSELTTSSFATYRTFPVILKFIQVVVGIVCVVIAAYDLVKNFDDLTARTATNVAGTQFAFSRDSLMSSVHPALKDIRHLLLIDQMSCRIIFLAVTAILLVLSLIQLIWFPVSIFTGPTKSWIISGVLYHLIGFGLLLGVSVNLLARINLLESHFYNENLMRNVVCAGVTLAVLYLLSGIAALWYSRELISCCSESRSQARHQFSLKRLEEASL